MNKSESLFEKAKNIIPGGVHSPVRAFKNVETFPRFTKEAKGSFLCDVESKKYLDFCMSWGPLLLGHQDEDVKEAVISALNRGWSYGTADEPSLELAEWITEKISAIEKVRFVSSGTEAVMSALRLARGVTRRDKVLKFDGCYHGHVDSMLVAAGSGLCELAKPDSDGVSKSTASDTLVAPLGDINAVQKILASHKVAAIIIEPLPANNGLLPQSNEFLKSLETLCRENGCLLIFDEVISGFRVSLGGMAEISGVTPDLITYGKIIGGGFPVGAFGGRKDLMNHLAPDGGVYQAGTLSGNPVAMTAGLATLQKIEKLNPYESFNQKTGLLRQSLITDNLSVHTKLVTAGSLFWMVLSQNEIDHEILSPTQIPSDQKSLYADLYPVMLNKGIYLAPSGFEVGFLATTHTDDQICELAKCVNEALAEVYPK